MHDGRPKMWALESRVLLKVSRCHFLGDRQCRYEGLLRLLGLIEDTRATSVIRVTRHKRFIRVIPA